MFSPIALLEGIGGPELLFIGILALLMFGSKRLPDLGRSFGRAIREFKRATSGVEENLREVMREPKPNRIHPAKKATPAKAPPAAPPEAPKNPPSEESAEDQEVKKPTFSDSVSDDFGEDPTGKPPQGSGPEKSF